MNEDLLDPPVMTRASRKALARRQRKDEKTSRRPVERRVPLAPRNERQGEYLQALHDCDQVFGVGPAGTGKTYLAARWAIRQVLDRRKECVVICRPTAAKPKHRLGFRPGNQDEKVADWLVPIMDGFKDECGAATIAKMKIAGQIEFAAFETMRGRTFRNAVVILDEAQNCDMGDLRLFLTRIGEGSQVIVDGDLDQIDIDDPGLEKVLDMVEEFDLDADVIEFEPEDVVRSAIARGWVGAFARSRR
jgi:phosphate starvation-inducible PhoH-like protein